MKISSAQLAYRSGQVIQQSDIDDLNFYLILSVRPRPKYFDYALKVLNLTTCAFSVWSSIGNHDDFKIIHEPT